VRVLKGDVKEILCERNEVTGVRYFSPEGMRTIPAYSVILATGGMSYPKTGSDGSGYKLASKLGHTIITPRPSLVPLVTKESWPGELTGLSLKNVNVIFAKNGKELFSEQGEMLFTHFGVSGPLVLSGSAYLKEYPAEMYIDMKPALSPETLDARLLSDFDEYKNKDFINSLEKLLPKAMIPIVASLSGIDEHKKVNSVTKEERKGLVSLLKGIPLTITGPRPVEEAIVTSGGVKVSEVNPSTMESKIISRLFFAGEVLDVDCYTGGYNLQAAFCTGFLAGESAVK
jgi:predicted Rossmann fold flavoprotein